MNYYVVLAHNLLHFEFFVRELYTCAQHLGVKFVMKSKTEVTVFDDTYIYITDEYQLRGINIEQVIKLKYYWMNKSYSMYISHLANELMLIRKAK